MVQRDVNKIDHNGIDVFVVVDMAKEAHYAQAITTSGEELFNRPVTNDEAAIVKIITDAKTRGRVVLVIDMPSDRKSVV